MSNTRTAQPGGPLNQERWASSPVFQRGLMANLVAKRISVLTDPGERALIWFLQWLSWQPGGLAQVPVAGLDTYCLNPEATLTAEAAQAVRAFRSQWLAARAAGRVQTSVGRRIADALDYTLSARIVSIIDGPARIGKSFAARAWCEQSAGLARYCQVPSTADEQSFLRAIATALGVAIRQTSKAVELRTRVEETLHSGDLGLVMDEAAYLFSQTWQRYAQPARVNWIMTALANFNVPVALVSCPHFYQNQTRTEKLTGWNSAQMVGRIGHVERLPEKLGRADLLAVAAAQLPEGSPRAHAQLAIYAEISAKHLASIEAIVKRARWLAGKEGRDKATDRDVNKAIDESVLPSDSALAVALKQARRPVGAPVAMPSPMPRGERFWQPRAGPAPATGNGTGLARNATGRGSGRRKDSCMSGSDSQLIAVSQARLSNYELFNQALAAHHQIACRLNGRLCEFEAAARGGERPAAALVRGICDDFRKQGAALDACAAAASEYAEGSRLLAVLFEKYHGPEPWESGGN